MNGLGDLVIETRALTKRYGDSIVAVGVAAITGVAAAVRDDRDRAPALSRRRQDS